MTETDPEARAKLTTRTRLTSAGRKPGEQFGFVNTPIYRGSTVLYPTYADLQARNAPYTYATHGTPTVRALEEAWSELAGAETTSW